MVSIVSIQYIDESLYVQRTLIIINSYLCVTLQTLPFTIPSLTWHESKRRRTQQFTKRGSTLHHQQKQIQQKQNSFIKKNDIWTEITEQVNTVTSSFRTIERVKRKSAELEWSLKVCPNDQLVECMINRNHFSASYLMNSFISKSKNYVTSKRTV